VVLKSFLRLKERNLSLTIVKTPCLHIAVGNEKSDSDTLLLQVCNNELTLRSSIVMEHFHRFRSSLQVPRVQTVVLENIQPRQVELLIKLVTTAFVIANFNTSAIQPCYFLLNMGLSR
jgi:hypothetical protein